MNSWLPFPTAVALAGLLAPPLKTAAQTASAPAAPAADTVVLSPYEVVTSQDVGYRSTFSTSGTLVREELSNLPSSISVLNQEFLQDIGSVNIFEASRYATGGEFGQVNDTNFFFRGIQNNWQARNFFIWYLPTDQFSVERLEVVRGPNALLYGDAQPGGLMNIISKRANLTRDASSARLMLGSWERYRAEADVNRVLIPNRLAVRVNVAWQESEDWRDFRYDNFRGANAAVQWQPFRGTRVRFESEAGRIDRNQGHGVFTDNFSSPATQAIPAAQSWVAVRGTLAALTGPAALRSTGSTLLLTGASPVARERQFAGHDQFADRSYTQYAAYVEQTLFQKLTLEGAFHVQDQQNRVQNFTGANAVRRDIATVLPSGAPNPSLNHYYVDRAVAVQNISNRTTDYRLSGVYELEVPRITTQRLIAFWTQRTDLFDAQAFQERRLANLNNQVFRRHYVGDYSDADLAWSPLSGATRRFGAGFWADNEQTLTARSVAAVGSYLDGRVRSLVGYRRDKWEVLRGNAANGGVVTTQVPNPAGGTAAEFTGFDPSRRTRDAVIRDDSLNYGVVGHVLRNVRGLNLSVFGNYSESFRPVSGALDLNGGAIAPIKGEGTEYGLRLEAFEGKAALNLISYTIDQVNSPINIGQNIRDEINALFGANTVVAAGANTVGDTSTIRSEGFEVELTLNPRPHWTFTANFARNDKQQASVLPVTTPYWERARNSNRPLVDYQNLNNLVASSLANADLVAPEIRDSWNLFTRYRFTDGPLKNISLGGGINYRDRGYLGAVGTTGFYSESSTVVNALVGYRGKWRNYTYDVTLNVNNVTDEDYYVAYALNAAGWSNPREYRLSTTVRF
jgi:outer membrane receptor protein involved in Fe transport